MNPGQADGRLLFPTPVLGGLAKEILARHVPTAVVHGVVNRGPTSVYVLVSHDSRRFQLGVRYVSRAPGEVFVTSMHRQNPRPMSEGGGTTDDRRAFLVQSPDDRVTLRASRYAFRMWYESGLKKIAWDKTRMAYEREKLNHMIDRLALSESFTAIVPDGRNTCVVPIPDYINHPEWIKELPTPQAAAENQEKLLRIAQANRRAG